MTQPPVPDPSTPPPPESASGLPAVPVGRQAHLWGIRRAIAVALGGAVGLVGVLVAAALWAAGFPALKRDGTVTRRPRGVFPLPAHLITPCSHVACMLLLTMRKSA